MAKKNPGPSLPEEVTDVKRPRYIVVTSSSFAYFLEQVNEKLAEGYEPIGGVAVEGEEGSLHQAMLLAD